MPENKHIIEINGVKLEVDLRTAKRIDELKVGSRVKVLKKQYSDFKVFHGVIIGFEPFKNVPTIIVAYMEVTYAEAKLEFLYYTGKQEDVEMIAALDDDVAALDQSDICRLIDNEVTKHELEVKKLQERKEYFLRKFAAYWAPIEAPKVG